MRRAVMAVALAIAPAAWAGDLGTIGGAAAFERLKALAGDWEGHVQQPDGPPGQVTWRVASGGSVVMETLFPGSEHEMISMYHLEGEQLVMTHYCAMANQPRMRLAPGSTAGELRFDFTGGANLDPATTPHVHSGSIRFPGADRLEAEWQVWSGGKPSGANRFYLRRKPVR